MLFSQEQLAAETASGIATVAGAMFADVWVWAVFIFGIVLAFWLLGVITHALYPDKEN